DANNLGGYNTQYITAGNELLNTDPAPYDHVIGEFYYYQTTSGHSGTAANNQTYKGYDIPSYFNGELYVGLGGGSGSNTTYVGQLGFNLTNFPFTTASPRIGIEPMPNFVSSNLFGGRGTTAAISANGLIDGIVWNNDITQTGSDYLAAYSASATGTSINPIYTSNQNAARDSLTGGVTNATGVKFSVPTVFNGRVYDATGGGSGTGGHAQGTVVAYGLLSTSTSLGIFSVSQDVGAPAISGSSSYNSSTGIYTVAGAGTDISGMSDQFQFLYKSLTGDGTITAQVASITNTNSSAKAGIMFRNSPAANSTDLFLTLTPTASQGAKLEGRSSDGATATIDNSLINPIPPYWLRMTRVGNLFTAYTSPDGVNWTLLGSITIAMGATVDVGLAVTSHNTAALNTSTFQNVSIVPTPYIVNAANAIPSSLAGISANLSALGNENGSASGLTYTWATTSKPSGANPVFSVNGSSVAQNTSVTFDKAGVYTFQVTISDMASASIASSVNVTVNQTLTGISVSPPLVNLTSGQSQNLSATALDQFGNPLSTQPSFSWSLDAGSIGAVNSTGQFAAPLSPVGGATVRATSGSISGTAALSVSYLKGDANIDGNLTTADVAAMMVALVDLPSYQSNHSLSNADMAAILDVNGDSAISNADLQALISAVANAGGGSSRNASESGKIAISLNTRPTIAPSALLISDESNEIPPVIPLSRIVATFAFAHQTGLSQTIVSNRLTSSSLTTNSDINSRWLDLPTVDRFFQSQRPIFHHAIVSKTDAISETMSDDLIVALSNWWEG
ncbi:MAG TPA: hypothetical protein VGI75_03005, partial [Pirellulales bacterium]